MKYLKYLSYVLLAISAILVVLFYSNSDSDSSLNLILNWTIALFALCVVGAVVLPLLFSSGKGLKGSLIKVGVVAVLCAVSYAMASGDSVESLTKAATTPSALKLTDTGLILTIALFVLAILAILSGSVINSIRNR